ncbi:MAG: Rpn family recombination-promoting nuclease/putative transposase [Lachnospiraceae bacterium]|jgi:predicted transposase/invertase (TIGR01784 family)|nr:Rpn family recombination-promoting nuclease/putative transposase [Lachnospiraceae bacterium]
MVISILGFKLFECKEYYSQYRVLEVSRQTLLTDKLEMHYFELPKLPASIDTDNKQKLWLSLLNARTEEDLERLEKLEVPEMSQAIRAFNSIVVSPEFKELEKLLADAKHNEASALNHAERKGREEGRETASRDFALRLIADDYPIDMIAKYTGLSVEEIEELQGK